MTRRIKNIIVLILIFFGVSFLIYYIVVLVEYKNELDRSNEVQFNNDYLPLEFKGSIIKFSSSQEEECFMTLRIKTEIDTLTYGLWVNKNSIFSHFVEKGDSVIKKKGDSQVKFIKKDGRQRSLELPF